ncbi:hypothetical protein GJ496_003198 [Pomphorhynchus laevis]|nr:hypothetical protein GJ496_003198 [Pomphorhynchus laevis]
MYQVNEFESELSTLYNAVISNDSKAEEDESNFYDPAADDEDNKWANASRRYFDDASMVSDATLNCPCCMTLLCTDCQRHVNYTTQYRAMFVYNCVIDPTKNAPTLNQRDSKKDDRKFDIVLCRRCNTGVAAYDVKDEVYHFYNVISGH